MIDRKIVYNLHLNNLSNKAIARQLGCTSQAIAYILKKYGIIKSERVRKIDESYFDNIDSEDKAYWLGFLLADGSIMRLTMGKKTTTKKKVLQLALGIEDIDHIKLFQEFIGSDHKIDIKLRESKLCGLTISAVLLITCARIYHALLSIGINQFNSVGQLPSIDSVLMPHLVRGLIDGDGWISQTTTHGIRRPRIGFCATTRLAVQSVIDYLNIRDITIREDGKIFRFDKTGDYCIEIYNILYSNSTVCLQRKKTYLCALIGVAV